MSFFPLLHPWIKILTRGYFVHHDKFSQLFKYIRFFKGTRTQIFSRLFTFLCDRVMFQSVMTANCPLYIRLPMKYDIYKGGFPKKLWDHKCLLACFLGDTPPLFHKHEMVKRPCFKTRLTSDLMPPHLGFFRRLFDTDDCNRPKQQIYCITTLLYGNGELADDLSVFVFYEYK